MLNRRVGGILVALWLVISMIVTAQSGLLYLNEEPLSLSHPMISQDSLLLLPLEEICPLLGLDADFGEDGITLRGPGFRQTFETSMFSMINGIVYASLEWILDWIGGEIHQVGGDVYVRTDRQSVVGLEATETEITVRLTGYSAHEIARSQQGLSEILAVSWPHSELGMDAQLIRIGESNIQAIRMIDSANGVRLSLTLESGTVLATEQLETDEFCSITFRVAETASSESIINVDTGIVVHEWQNNAFEARAVDYVYVEAWRDRYRLQPTVPISGFQSTASLQSILQEAGFAAAISLGCSGDPGATECLVMNGLPYLIPDTPSEVLAIDLFGRWSSFSSLCTVDVKHAGQRIAIDGVNRPLAYGEILVYSAGYDGDLVRGIPGSFTAIKVRENRVVSVYQGLFVPEDSSAILLVASGEAMAVLSDIQLGDPIEVVCQFVHAEGTYPHAVSSGPQVMGDGVLLSPDPLFEQPSLPSSGAVLASDWQGGLYLLTFAGADAPDLEQDWSLRDILVSLPTTLKDAVLLSSCERNAIAYRTDDGAFQLGPVDSIRLALGLIPLTP